MKYRPSVTAEGIVVNLVERPDTEALLLLKEHVSKQNVLDNHVNHQLNKKSN